MEESKCKSYMWQASSNPEYIKNSTIRRQITQLKNGFDLNRHFSQENRQTASKYVKRLSTSLVIREMQTQIKTTMRRHFTLSSLALGWLKSQWQLPGVARMWLTPASCIAGENVGWYSCFGEQLGSFSKCQIWSCHVTQKLHS